MPKNEPSADLIMVLEDLLERAKAGDITSMGFIVRGKDDSNAGNGWTDGFIDNPAEALGWLGYMQQRIYHNMSFVETE
jgi:hypothetical protein